MKLIQPRSETCIGLSIEGDLLRLAVVTRAGSKILVRELASQSISISHAVKAGSGDDEEFDFLDVSEDEVADDHEIIDFLHAHYVKRAPLAISYGEPVTQTFLININKKDNNAKILKKILADVQQSHNVELSSDMADYARTTSSSAVAAARLEALPYLETFMLPKGGERRATQIGFITTNDIALINLVRVHFRFKDGEITHVIHVGKDETRLYIMRGTELLHIAPPIMQGSRDRNIVSLLINRIELAADNAGYPNPDHIVLSGDAEQIGLKSALRSFNDEVIFHTLSRLRVRHGDDERIDDLHEYVLPISVAWQQLQPKNPHFYRINLMPERIKDELNKAKIAWHGLLLILALFVTTTFLTIQGLQQQAELASEQASLAFEKQQIELQQEVVQRIQALEERSQQVRNATTTLDTLLVGAEIWSETLDTLITGVGALRSMWISEIKPIENGIKVGGYSLNRPNIPALTKLIGDAKIQEVATQVIGEKSKVYRFDMNLEIPPSSPYGESAAARWHRRISSRSGMSTGLPGNAVPDQNAAPDGESHPKEGGK